MPSTDKNAHQHNVDRGREFSMSSSPRDTPAWTLASDKSSSIAKRPVATVKLLHWQNMDEEKDAEAAETKSEGKADEDISQSPASKIRPRLSATFRSVSRQKLDQLEVCMLLPPAQADTHALAMQRKEQHNPPVGHYRPRFTVVERPPRPVSILRGERFVDLAAQASERGTRSVPLASLFVSVGRSVGRSFGRSFISSATRRACQDLTSISVGHAGRTGVRPRPCYNMATKNRNKATNNRNQGTDNLHAAQKFGLGPHLHSGSRGRRGRLRRRRSQR